MIPEQSKMEKLTIQQIAPYLPYGIEVEYEGILNGDEIKAYDKEFEKEHRDDFFATNQDYYKPPAKVIGKKRGYIKEVGFFLEYTRYRIGKKGLQTHNNTDKFKPVLYPISCLTKEITHNGETFVPKEKLREISGAIEPDKDLKNTFDIKISEGKVIGFSALCMYVDQYALFQKLAEWHINFVGIPEGLYIDKSKL